MQKNNEQKQISVRLSEEYIEKFKEIMNEKVMSQRELIMYFIDNHDLFKKAVKKQIQQEVQERIQERIYSNIGHKKENSETHVDCLCDSRPENKLLLETYTALQTLVMCQNDIQNSKFERLNLELNMLKESINYGN